MQNNVEELINQRIKSLLKKFNKYKIGGLLLTSSPNISYLTGFTSRDSYLLLHASNSYYITDSRYSQEAKKNLSDAFKVKQLNGSLISLIDRLCRKLKIRNLGFEENYLTVKEFNKLKSGFKYVDTLTPTFNWTEELRMVKSDHEIDNIRTAAKITSEAFDFIQDFIAPGRTELEIAAELEKFIRKKGARCASFDIIVASCPNSSYPHHLTSNRVIKNNEPVLIDMGVDYEGYKSDLTRTYFLGKISVLAKKIYDTVLKAQARAIGKIRPAEEAVKIDAACRKFIKKKGYAKNFGHSTGHGVGLEVHEAPAISVKSNIRLKKGMIFTVEPGIYLAGRFGVRIEDMVLVTRKGVEVISGSLNK